MEFRPAETGTLAAGWPSVAGPDVNSEAAAAEPSDLPGELVVPLQTEPEQLDVVQNDPAAPRSLNPAVIENARPLADARSRSLEKRTPMRLSPPEEALKGRVESATFAEDAETTGSSAVRTSGSVEGEETSEPKVAEGMELAQVLQQVDQQISAGEFLPAHKELSRIYWEQPDDRSRIRSRLESTANVIFFQPQPHFIEPYVIQPGDRLESIAKKYKLSWEYLSQLNRTQPTRIQAGKRLKVLKGPFGAAVDLQDFALTIHLQGYYVKRYEIGIGKDGSSPLGKFPVLNKVANPQYTDPEGRVIEGDDPQNPLGERWVDLGNSYGIHGTIEPDSIGKAASRGCIRMRDADIVEVYNLLVVGSEVTLRD